MGRRRIRRIGVKEDHFTIDLADIGKRRAIQGVGQCYRMAWRRTYQVWVRDPQGGVRCEERTSWVAARLKRTAHDKMSVLISSKHGGHKTSLMRWRVTLHLSRRENAVAGTRLWFICPDCGNPTRAVHWSGGWLRCRRCGGLEHRSAQTGVLRRKRERAKAILDELGVSGDHWSVFPDRPRYMHWSRYLDLQGEYIRAANVARRADNRRLERMSRGMWRVVAKLDRKLARFW